MRAMKLTGIRAMEMLEVADPAIVNPNDVLIRMKVVGVCGSDVHYYETGQIGSQVVDYPFAVGHEGAGVVEAVGPAVTRVKPGDRIAIEPAMSCGACDQCLADRPHTCRKLRFLGCPKQAEGCLSEYIAMPEDSCFKVSDKTTFDEAAISEPLAIGVYAVKQSIPMQGARVGILGAGCIGLSVLLPAKAQGADKIYVTDKIDTRLDLAAKAGAAWGGNPDREDVVAKVAELEPGGLDVVFECCGEQDALDQAIDMLKPGGKLLLIGIPPTAKRVSFLIDELRHKEICIQNVRRQNHCVQPALDMMDRGDFDVNIMVTHRFLFEQTQAAFDLAASYADGVLKTMIDFPK
ncbi:MAG: alcohol dehydrogenase catalytic domain-containing protein [Lentisphaerae bacterium]|jgi:L-iditol 2-dehydrogenase|nr:alcohol dehydrogenase catalytic domain-containing protein [Lentisphaerota bacterium]MBT5606686.1 alcohol dehydrogenase catalytic domain-containing protein [Lentisphaerota bacterium]MBT7061377.1 alcohol dehydrogenase catalytic domain-containing protein [Lentisphaerota bacterium]MBT7844250.1 alcohol dehydrogenase catalytic domain-containing protein [Lentisphaerota bacterium]